MEKYNKQSEDFNSMPFEHRKIAVDSELVTRIRDLERYKKRLKANYDREIIFINQKIKNYNNSIGK